MTLIFDNVSVIRRDLSDSMNRQFNHGLHKIGAQFFSPVRCVSTFFMLGGCVKGVQTHIGV